MCIVQLITDNTETKFILNYGISNFSHDVILLRLASTFIFIPVFFSFLLVSHIPTWSDRT